MGNTKVRIPVQKSNTSSNSANYIKVCKFKVGDRVKLIKSLDAWNDRKKKPVRFPVGTILTIGHIKIRGQNLPIDAAKSGEIYIYTLVDDENTRVAEVGQYMFDATVAEEHKRKIKDLKKTCIKYKFIIGGRTLIKILLLMAAIATVILGMVDSMVNSSRDKFGISYVLVALGLFTIFIALNLLENIKYPNGLEITLMNKARSQAKQVYCTYDYYNMTIIS